MLEEKNDEDGFDEYVESPAIVQSKADIPGELDLFATEHHSS